MKTVYLSLGSNLGDRAGMLREALRLLAGPRVRVLRVSPIYESEPQDAPRQPWFLNLVAEVETELFPRQLLLHLQKVERELGRVRNSRHGPRTIDIDIVLFGSSVIDTADLTVPHPQMSRRRFVLQPLADLVPGLRRPRFHRPVRHMLRKLHRQALRPYAAALI